MYRGRSGSGRGNSGNRSGGGRRGGRPGGRRHHRGRHGGGEGRYGNGRRGGGGRRTNLRQSAESGNQRERIAVESGQLVLIDQFMLANPQFIDRLLEIIDAEPGQKTELINHYGGQVVSLPPGTYRIERDPFAQSIIIHPEEAHPDSAELAERAERALGYVFVDTRCLAMVDRELLDDSALLQKYQQLWFSGQDKACRDLLRDNGGAVRYGFSRLGDELGVYSFGDDNVICLWPDVSEEGQPQAEEAAAG